MKLGISMWSYVNAWKAGQLDIPGFIREAKKLSADGVELLDFFYKDIDADRQAALDALAETGLPCGVFSVAQNFALVDPADREKELNKIRFGVDEALHFNAKTVRVFAGDVYADGPTLADARGWIVDGLVEGANYAQDRGVRLALENHGKLAGRRDQIRAIILEVRDRCGHDALGANPDTGNFLLVEQPSHEAIKEVAEFAYMVHFKDFAPAPEGYEGHVYQSIQGSRFQGTVIGEGDVNLAACVAELKAVGFDGWLNLEYEADADPFIGVPTSLRNARKFLAG